MQPDRGGVQLEFRVQHLVAHHVAMGHSARVLFFNYTMFYGRHRRHHPFSQRHCNSGALGSFFPTLLILVCLRSSSQRSSITQVLVAKMSFEFEREDNLREPFQRIQRVRPNRQPINGCDEERRRRVRLQTKSLSGSPRIARLSGSFSASAMIHVGERNINLPLRSLFPHSRIRTGREYRGWFSRSYIFVPSVYFETEGRSRTRLSSKALSEPTCKADVVHCGETRS